MPQRQKKQSKLSRLQSAAALYGAQIAEILDKDETAPDDLKAGDLTARFNAFANLVDPTHDAASQYKYLDWICCAYLQQAAMEKTIKAEDLSKIKADLRDFKAFSRLFDDPRERDINSYNSYDALLEQIVPYQQARDARKAAKAKVTEEVEAGTIVVYEGPEGKIVRPTTREACQFWGMGTRWCIAATSSRNYFDTYYKPDLGKHVYIYLPAEVSIQERKRFSQLRSFKYAGAGDALWNELDKKISNGLIPPALGTLIKAAEQSEDTFEKEHWQEHGFYKDKTFVPQDPDDWDNADVMTPFVAEHRQALIYTRNKDIVLKAVGTDCDALQFTTDAFRADEEVVRAAIAHDGYALVHAVREMWFDSDIVDAAYKNCGRTSEATDIIYNGAEGFIVSPKTSEALRFWGGGASWNSLGWQLKSEKDPFVIYIPKSISDAERAALSDSSLFKFLDMQGSIYDESKKGLGFVPVCVQKLIDAAGEGAFEREGLSGYQGPKDVYIPSSETDWNNPTVMEPILKSAPFALAYSSNPNIILQSIRDYKEGLVEMKRSTLQDQEAVIAEANRLLAAGDSDGLARFFMHAAEPPTPLDALEISQFVGLAFACAAKVSAGRDGGTEFYNNLRAEVHGLHDLSESYFREVQDCIRKQSSILRDSARLSENVIT